MLKTSTVDFGGNWNTYFYEMSFSLRWGLSFEYGCASFEAWYGKECRLWMVEGLALERCSTFGKKDNQVSSIGFGNWELVEVKVDKTLFRSRNRYVATPDPNRPKCPPCLLDIADASPRYLNLGMRFFSSRGYCDNHDLSRLDNQSIEHDVSVGIGLAVELYLHDWDGSLQDWSSRGLNLTKIKNNYSSVYTKLILRVKKLEAQIKVGKARRHSRFVLSDTKVGEDDSSKQGRKFSNEGVQDDEGVHEKASTDTEIFVHEEVLTVSTAEATLSTAGGTVTILKKKCLRKMIVEQELKLLEMRRLLDRDEDEEKS
ncbi:hypothetical protein Tco_0493410 [Tanacetum coccineum]